MQSYILPPILDKNIQELKSLIERYRTGEISFAELKAHRVPFGVYEQRERDTYMIRVRCAGGVITPCQLERIAALAKMYSSGSIHLTTRQEVQLHYIKLYDIVSIIQELKKIGMASRGGGGNTVRNIICQDDAGIDKDEVFDVTPYAISLTSRLIAEEDSWTLPRKFKVAFSGSSDDKGYATLADVGFIAQTKKNIQGFKVYAAGGMGAKSLPGSLLLDFIKEDEVYNVAKALKRLFWKNGNRKNKHAARLRFLWQKLGPEKFKELFLEEYEEVKKTAYPPLEVQDIQNIPAGAGVLPEEPEDKKDFNVWQKRFVIKQKQEKLFSVILPVEFGFITADKAASLGSFLKNWGDNVIRLTREQNIRLRNIPGQLLPNLYKYLKKNQDNFNRALLYDRIISCAGASTCQLGICFSRGAVNAILQKLAKSSLDLDSVGDLKINISGCPNSCGQHPAADIGFFGKAVRKNGKLYPAYTIVAGAIIHEGKTKLAEPIGGINARDLPLFVYDFLTKYINQKKHYNNFNEYLNNKGIKGIRAIIEKYQDIPEFEKDKNYYYDWGSKDLFSLASRGAGECSAGIFDLIDIDLENMKKVEENLSTATGDQKAELIRKLIFYSARTLLITRGVEPKEEKDVYAAFDEHFIITGIVDKRTRDLLTCARNREYDVIQKKETEAHQLKERIRMLYEVMDNAFNFNIEKKITSQQKDIIAQNESTPHVIKDFRGVACPMNFVKTKMELSQIKSGEILEIWLDDGEPIENVPGSVRNEGHNIINQKKNNDYWIITIKKN